MQRNRVKGKASELHPGGVSILSMEDGCIYGSPDVSNCIRVEDWAGVGMLGSGKRPRGYGETPGN